MIRKKFISNIKTRTTTACIFNKLNTKIARKIFIKYFDYSYSYRNAQNNRFNVNKPIFFLIKTKPI